MLRLVRREVAIASRDLRPPKASFAGILCGLIAVVGAFIALLVDTIRFGRHPQEVLGGGPWLAVHPEWSNRTRHVLPLACEMEQPVGVIILGRPRADLDAVERMLEDHAPGVRFRPVRPLNFTALLCALPTLTGASWIAFREIVTNGAGLPVTGSLAVFYRVGLGCVSSRWWHDHGARPDLIIFGHTGNADTSLLEHEMQRAGATTVHLFHGFSNGLPYAGISNLAVTRCAHDARWHESLGSYQRTAFVPAPPVEPSAPKDRWALLTNYAHPTFFRDPREGVRWEIAALRLAAGAAERAGIGAANLWYRPHPSFHALSPGLRAEVLAEANRLGLRDWSGDMRPDDLGGFETVITTPSTIVADALNAGTLPVVLDLSGTDEESLYRVYPFVASTAEGLDAQIADIRSDRRAAFARAWSTVGPGIVPSIEMIRKLAREDEYHQRAVEGPMHR